MCYDLIELNVHQLSVQSREKRPGEKKEKRRFSTSKVRLNLVMVKILRSAASCCKYEAADCPRGDYHCSYINSSPDEHCSFGVSMLHCCRPLISHLLIDTLLQYGSSSLCVYVCVCVCVGESVCVHTFLYLVLKWFASLWCLMWHFPPFELNIDYIEFYYS